MAKTRRRVFAVGIGIVVLGLASQVGLRGFDGKAGSDLAMCENTGTPPPIQHVVVMFLENASFNQVIGKSDAPYINGTLTARCGVATQAFVLTHTSAANYLGVSAGQYPAKSPRGCASVSACSSSVPTLYSQMMASGRGWRNYVEGATSNCDKHSVHDTTKIGHDPGLFFPSIDCAADVVPVRSLTDPDNGSFWTALNTNTLSGLTWLSPTQDHVGEGGSVLPAQEHFLGQFLPKFVASAAYQSGTTALVITYDEGRGRDTRVGEACADEAKDLAGRQNSCHVPLWVVYPYNRGGHDKTFFDLYSITKGVEDLFGEPYLGHAADAKTTSLMGHFGLARYPLTR